MTTFLIDDDSYDSTTASTPAFSLGNNDDLILTGAGELVATGSNSDALDIGGATNEATIQGLVFGTNFGIGVTSSTAATLFVTSDVSGENTGIHIQGAGASAHVTIEAAGIVEGGGDDGIYADDNNDYFTINGAVSGANYGINVESGGTANVLVGAAGSVSGTNGGINFSGNLTSSQLTIDGIVSSAAGSGITLDSQYGQLNVVGDVQGAIVGILSTNSSQSMTIDGVVQGEGGVGPGSGVGVQIEADDSTLVDDGEVEGSSNGILVNNESAVIGAASVYVGARGEATGIYGVSFEGTSSGSITNDGHVSGAYIALEITASTRDVITNDGVISTGGGQANGFAVDLQDSSDIILHNAGLIASPGIAIQAFDGTTATIENTGTIQGELIINGATVDVENSGNWESSLGLDIGGTGDNTLTNSGTIHGPITFGSGANALTNSGRITGSITFQGTADTLTNRGEVYGQVTMGTNDTIANDGTIHGNVILGTGDTFDGIGGLVTGMVTAANSDTFDFSGSFGHNTISAFAWSGTTHDTISFNSDDFANYAAVQSHMAQVGNDVVITLDPEDTIVLLHQTLAHLTTHDFVFT